MRVFIYTAETPDDTRAFVGVTMAEYQREAYEKAVDSVAKELGPAGIVRFVSALTGHLDIKKICGLKLAQNLCILDKAILCGLMLEDCSKSMIRSLHAQQEAVTALQKYIDHIEKEQAKGKPE